MKLENTSFTREHTGAEDKAQGIKVRLPPMFGNRNGATGTS